MEDDELSELIQYVRQRLRELGRADIDERIVEARLAAESNPRGRALTYLSAVRREMLLGTNEVTRQTMTRLLTNVRTSDGRPPEGIVVELSEGDRETYGVPEINLAGSPQVDELISQLDELIAQIQEEEG